MKIICTADIHIGYKAYSQIDKITGLSEREIKTIKLLNESIDYTINNKADAYVFAGDMFKNNQPSPTVLDYVNKAFNRLSVAGIKTFILDGNHDVSKVDMFSSGLAQFKALNIPNIIQTRFEHTEIFNNIRFLFLPTYHTKQDIENIINKLDNTYPTIVIGHLAINKAMLNGWTIIEKEECIPVETFNKECIKAVVLGHFHKYQILNKKPLTFYTGSLNRCDFSEEQDPKGFIELNIDELTNEVTHTFHELDATKFLTINYTGEENCTQEIISLIDKKAKDINNAIVRIKVDIPREEQIDEKLIIQTIVNHKAKFILKIQRTDSREISISQDESFYAADIYAAIEKFLEDDKRKEPRILLAKEIVKHVEEQ